MKLLSEVLVHLPGNSLAGVLCVYIPTAQESEKIACSRPLAE